MPNPSQPRPETQTLDQTPGGPSGGDEQRVQALFEEWILLRDQGLDVPAADLCRGCPHLGERLAQEIALHRRFEPPSPVAAGPPEPPVKEFAGLRYQPVRYHAQGGLGVVFVARDTEVGRDVALKRIQERRKHLPQDRERFPREAQITGRLEHPGIVPVYSVGHDASGQPYYTMRLVEGHTLAEAIEAFHQGGQRPRTAGERNQGLRALLTRFVAVCHTIGYAHSRGVIHRDLKPSNVLLGDYGETLVIDWGLARQRGSPEVAGGPGGEGRSPDTGSGTQTGKELGTRGFMSPEQARGDWVQVAPASDVFSLGATLYAILTGRAPYGGASSLDDARAGKFARPRQVSRAVPPALEAVCLKAMAARSEERYPGAQDLAADVQCWLDDEPVRARREPLPQRLGRWGRRHRTLVAAGFVLLAAVVLGLSLGLWAVGREQARALAAEKDARQHLEQAEANLKLARRAIDECFNITKTHPLFQRPGMEQARKLLQEKTLPFYRNFRAQRPDDPVLQREEADQWFRVGYIELAFGRNAEALRAYEQARDLMAQLVKAHPKESEYQDVLASAHNNLGALLKTQGKGKEALEAYQQAHELQAKLLEAHPKVPEYQNAVARTHFNRGTVLDDLGKRAEALQEYQRAHDLQSELVKAHPKVPEYRDALARTHSNRGTVLDNQGKRAEALQEYQRARDLQGELAKAHPDVPAYRYALALTHFNRGYLLANQGKGAEALQDYQRAHDLQSELVKVHPDVPEYRNGLAQTLTNRGAVLAILGKGKEALEAHQQAHDLQAKLVKGYADVPEYQDALARTHNNRAVLLANQGKGPEALQEFRQARDLLTRLVKAHPDVPGYVEMLGRLGWHRGLLLAQMGRDRDRDSMADLDEGIALLDRVRRLDPLSAQVPTYLFSALQVRAAVLNRMGRPRDAAADKDRALAVARQWPELRLAWALTQARAGDYRTAAAEADDMARTPSLSGSTLYDLACVLALSASAAARDADRPLLERAPTAEGYARRAVALLGRAHQAGFFRDPADRAHLDRDDDLTFLRERDDYRAFVKTLGPKTNQGARDKGHGPAAPR
jgi:eukaryotic-like serine/threonine-protein kinase